MKEAELLKLALLKSHNVAYSWDIAADSITWNGDIHSILGLGKEAKIYSKKQYSSLIHKLDRAKFLHSLKTCAEKGGDYSRSYRFCSNEGGVIQVWDRGTLIKKGKKKYLIGIINTNEQHADLGSKINDPASQFQQNQTSEYFNQELLKKLSEIFQKDKEGHKNSVLLNVSIDNLAMMMTWYTIDFAERIMSALEVELKKLIGKSDVIRRISINKFGIILKNHSKLEAQQVIDRILHHVQLYKNPSFEEQIHLRTSIGSVSFPESATDAQDAMNKAYLALSIAKNKTSEFHCDYQQAKKQYMDTKNQISQLNYMRSAFSEKRLHLAYQPIVECKTGKVNKYECLLRVEEADGKMNSAGRFIPVAEKMGFIEIIDRFVLETVVNELKQNKDVMLSFNVSNMTTDNPKWLKMCTKLLQDDSVASRIIVEVTETAAHRDMRQTAYFVAALQALGCQVALDDFGAGYTSFRQLKSLSMDMIKIDGSYITNLAENSENILFIKTLLNFNQSYGLETVAECVESGEVAKILIELGVDYLQGYYFGKPDLARPWANERPPYEEQVRM